MIKVRSVLLDEPSGWYPMGGSVYRGGGFSLGGGYRRYYQGRTFWDAKGLYSIRNYKLVQVGTTAVSRAPGQFSFSLRAGWRDATQVAYYGTGMDTSADNRTNFRLQQTYAGGFMQARPHRWIFLRGEADYEHYAIQMGQGRHPSIEEEHTPETAPSLGTDPTFLRVGGGAAFDWRRSPGYSRTGGSYGATLQAWVDRDSTFSFERLDIDLIQHVPILRETWVLSFRGRVETVLDEDDVVPFFLLSSLGSGNTLRAYFSDRFRDRHSLLTSAEWRWIPNPNAFDMAVFFDAGKVTARRSDLNFENLATNWGVGARFHGVMMTALRVEVAKGREGWRLVFAASPAF